MPSLPFTDGFYSLPNTSIANLRCVNWLPVISQSGARSQSQLIGVDGIETVLDLGGKIRGSIFFQGSMYYLAGNDFVKVDKLFNVTTIKADAVGGFNQVFMAENGLVITLVNPNGESYFYDPDTGFGEIVDDDFEELTSQYGRAIGVTFSDGFFVYNTERIIFNGSLKTTNKGKDFNALEFTEAEQFTDNLVRVIYSQGSVYAFGDLSYEIYRLKPTSTIGEFPFQRIAIQNNEYGLFGRYNVVDANSVLYFIGGSKREKPSVWELQGSNVKKISTDAVDYLIDTESPNTSFSLAYTLGGRFHRAFTFPDTTLVYDSSTQRWHERQSGNFVDGIWLNNKGWQVQTIDRAFNVLLAGNDEGKIGIIKQDVFTEYGETLRDYFTTQPFSDQQKDFSLHRMEAVCQSGVGNDDIEEPTIAFSFSDDGVEFGKERYRSLGKRGDRDKRQVWRNQGRFDQDTVLRCAVSAPCRRAVIDLVGAFL